MEVDSRLGRKFIIPRPFQLTTSRGGRQRWESTAEQVIFFNSRPLVEVDSWTSLHLFLAIFFNSRPLVEVDQLHCEHYTDGIFSTHDLSWRSTKTHHIITCNDFFFNSRPLVEIDCTEICFMCDLLFSTHDLSWRSTHTHIMQRLRMIFSTHDLSWRSTRKLLDKTTQKAFQLTTSRGDRPASYT